MKLGPRSTAVERAVLGALLLSGVWPLVGRAADEPALDPIPKVAALSADHQTELQVRPRTTRHTPAAVIDESVRRLTRGLDLSAAQQTSLREILLDQQGEILRLRAQGAEPMTDRVAMRLAIVDRTKVRIRAMLTDEQREKYLTDVPREQTAVAQADLKHWIDIQAAKRQTSKDDSQ